MLIFLLTVFVSVCQIHFSACKTNSFEGVDDEQTDNQESGHDCWSRPATEPFDFFVMIFGKRHLCRIFINKFIKVIKAKFVNLSYLYLYIKEV